MQNKDNNQFSFLPKDFETSSPSSKYIKLEGGETCLRILSKAIGGWLQWQDKKPLRSRIKPKQDLDPQRPAKQFLAMVAYDRTKEQIGIWEITQSTLIKALGDLTMDSEWGNPVHYDLKVNKSGSGVDTRYKVRPVVPKPLSPEIKEMFVANPCNLEALFTGDNPWNVEGLAKDQLAQGLFSEGGKQAVPF